MLGCLVVVTGTATVGFQAQQRGRDESLLYIFI